jgi:hypothetical protein
MKNSNELASQTGWSELARPRFSPGLLLEAEDLNAGVDYTREVTRLLMRSLFGCGVVCGLEVTGTLSCNNQHLTVEIKPGLAFDCLGNPIHLAKTLQVKYEADCKPMPTSLCVVLEYTEKACRTRDLSCSPDEEGERAPTRSSQGFTVRLLKACPPGVCGCGAADSVGEGTSKSGECCQDEAVATPPEQKAKSEATGESDQCACYAKHNAGECGCDCACGGVFLALLRIDAGAVSPTPDKRRMIRPVLTGFLGCIQPPTQPPAPTDPQPNVQPSQPPNPG